MFDTIFDEKKTIIKKLTIIWMGKPLNLSRQTFKKKYPVFQRTSMYSKEFYTKKRLKKKQKSQMWNEHLQSNTDIGGQMERVRDYKMQRYSDNSVFLRVKHIQNQQFKLWNW